MNPFGFVKRTHPAVEMIWLLVFFIALDSTIVNNSAVNAQCIVRDDCSYALRIMPSQSSLSSSDEAERRSSSSIVFEGAPVRLMKEGMWHDLSCQKVPSMTRSGTNRSWVLDYGLLSLRIENVVVTKEDEEDGHHSSSEICVMTYTTKQDIIVGHTARYNDGDGISTFPSFLKQKQDRQQHQYDGEDEGVVGSHHLRQALAVHPSPETTSSNQTSTSLFTLDGQLSWKGTFVRPKVNEGCTSGILGGPCVLYERSNPSHHGTTVMLSPLNQFLTTTQYVKLPHSDGKDINDDDELIWGGSTKSSIELIPKGYSHSFVAMIGHGGITDTIDKWGSFLKNWKDLHQAPRPQTPSTLEEKTKDPKTKWYDLTIQTLGYQTDNGAQYCYCEKDCDQALINKLNTDLIQTHNVPIRYLSYQNSWWKTTWSSPWCVSDWDAWNTSKVPMGVPEFSRQLNNIPLQLYAPYFCNDTIYKKDFDFITSNRSLPLCRKRLDFRQVVPEQSYDFFHQFFLQGMSYGMMSYEWDFITENVVCNDHFHTTIGTAETFIHGMVQAGQDLNLTMQWCMPPPAIALQSIYYPSVTNARASDDYLVGDSWEVGTSSLLLWALNLAPSTDTFWTSDNGDVAAIMGGCIDEKCPPDHSNVGCELHTILAVMSTGPVGFSDAINQTNAERILRTCRSNDGVLLQPSKPLTTLDTYLDQRWRMLQSYSGPTVDEVFAYYIVAHHLTNLPGNKIVVNVADLWPHPRPGTQWFVVKDGGGSSTTRNDRGGGGNGTTDPCMTDGAPASECGEFITVDEDGTGNNDGDHGTITLHETKYDFEPTRISIFRVCPETGWVLLGELSKYVSVSIPYRFTDIECLDSGLLYKVHGSSSRRSNGKDDSEETITVSAIHGGQVHAQTIKIISNQDDDDDEEDQEKIGRGNSENEEVVIVGRFSSTNDDRSASMIYDS